MAIFLGLDLGTTAVKGLLCSETGQVLSTTDLPIKLLRPRPGWVEQDMEALWEAVVEVVRRLTVQLKAAGMVQALSLSVASGNTLLIGEDGQPIGPAIHWMDSRAEPEMGQLLSSLDPDTHYCVTGWRLSGMSPLGHLAWLRQHAPERLAAAQRFCMTNDFVLERLCGRSVMDPSDASTSGLYDQAGERWHQPYLDLLDMPERAFSPLLSSGKVVGTLTAQAARLLGLSSSTLVVNGAHDQICAAIGAGVVRPGQVLLSCGTAWVILFPAVDRHSVLPLAEGIEPHLVPGLWAAMISLYGLGLTPTWYLKLVRTAAGAPTKSMDRLYHLFNDSAAGSPPGANGVLFSPLASGQAPFGALLRLGPSHTHGDVSRALMEGSVYETRIQLDGIREGGLPVASVRAAGGAMQSPTWAQIVADVLDLPVELVGGQSTAAKGAAILAGVGAGLFPDPASAASAMTGAERRIEPEAGRARRYQELYALYLDAVDMLGTLG
jgi:xylulokinase